MIEDPRKTGLKNGLRQLTVEQLQRVIDYPGEMVLDSLNYADGNFCPLAIGLSLDKKITNPSHNVVYDTLISMGYKVYNTRGIEGEFYRDNRKEALLKAAKEVLADKQCPCFNQGILNCSPCQNNGHMLCSREPHKY